MFGSGQKSPEVQSEPCPVCQGPMQLIRTIPAAGDRPPLYTFKCAVCTCPRTIDCDLPKVDSPTVAA